jgi:hypothetical protein
MDTLPSAKFRKRFASLTEPTMVTANGHPIGRWLPFAPTVTGGTYTLTVDGMTTPAIAFDATPAQLSEVQFGIAPARDAAIAEED